MSPSNNTFQDAYATFRAAYVKYMNIRATILYHPSTVEDDDYSSMINAEQEYTVAKQTFEHAKSNFHVY
jgi:hypothetical protein